VPAEPNHHPQKKCKSEPSDKGTSTNSSVHQENFENFEKRARHKTREDRYEPKKEEKNFDRKDGEKRPRTKRAKKGDGKRAARKAGEDLMNNFTSKSIGQERLTVSANISICRYLR
jgi:hypothetical protein